MAEALGHMARGMINFGLAPAQAHPA
jgi:hemoglobin